MITVIISVNLIVFPVCAYEILYLKSNLPVAKYQYAKISRINIVVVSISVEKVNLLLYERTARFNRSGQSLDRRKEKAFKHDGISRKVRGRIFLRTVRKPLPDFYGSHNKFLLSLLALIQLFLFFPPSLTGNSRAIYFASLSSSPFLRRLVTWISTHFADGVNVLDKTEKRTNCFQRPRRKNLAKLQLNG